MSKKQYKPILDDNHAERNWKRLPLPAAIGLGALAAGAGLALGSFVYAYFATHPPRKRLRRTPADFAMPYTSVLFPSQSGKNLSGWFVSAPVGTDAPAVIVLCHGYPMNREEMLPYARILHQAGYATLLFDFRAMGESEGDLSSIGHHEVEDLAGALDYLESHPETADLPIGAVGLSLGAAVVLMTAAQDTRIRAIISEAAYPTLQKALEARFRVVMGPLGPQVARPVFWWAQRWVTVDAREVSPLAAIRGIGPRPVLLIQGKRDLLVNWRDTVTMFEAFRGPCELWLMERSGHSRCLRDEPAEYARRMTEFFGRNL